MEILYSKNREIKSINEFIGQENTLKDLKINEIIDLFDSISKYWMSSKCKVNNLFINEGLGFLIPWLKYNNIAKIVEKNFSNPLVLDEPCKDNLDNSYIFSRPLGVAVHWIAGNVPVLGVISLFQTLLTKNKSIVKVPKSYKEILPEILYDLSLSNFFNDSQKKHLDILLSNIFLIYIEREDIKSQKLLSVSADIRVAWGAKEAIESIIGLPKKTNCRDIIFGPKVSLSIATKESLQSNDDLDFLSKSFANDVFTFDQAGCNSPHNLIIEKGSNFNLDDIADQLSNAFRKKTKSNIFNILPIDNFNVLSKRFLYQSDLQKNVIFQDNQWNIFINYNRNINIEDPLYCRSIFLSEVKNINDIADHMPKNIQSIGILASGERKIEIIKSLSDYGVDRFPDIGKMSIFSHPWDGYLPFQQMVKWISTN
tara:strand:+ start:444 stop:1718 length:1275 start_codon:yes stop_codon:yes gene_type:complete